MKAVSEAEQDSRGMPSFHTTVVRRHLPDASLTPVPSLESEVNPEPWQAASSTKFHNIILLAFHLQGSQMAFTRRFNLAELFDL